MNEEKVKALETFKALLMIADINRRRIGSLEHELNIVWTWNVVMSAVVLLMVILEWVR